jgi:hypothetical protein
MMLQKLGVVHYKKPVSDMELQLIVKRIADAVGIVTVHSGDRDFRPQGSPKHSLHLSHRAADLHAEGMTDSALFDFLRGHKGDIFKSAVHRYQVIHHGRFTETEGEHIHLGDYHLIKSYTTGPGVSFFVEGMTPASRGVYTPVH